MSVLEHAPARVLGFDIGKDTISVFDTGSQHTQVIDNRRGAINTFLRGFDEHCLAICEPTGGHERLLLERLMAVGIPSHRANTLNVKAFIRSFGTLAKTDALDARGLALYGDERWRVLALFVPLDADQQALSELVARRLDLVAMKVAEQNRANSPARRAIKASCEAVLRIIERQIQRIEADIEALLRSCDSLRQRVELLQQLPGVGPRTAIGLAATMPELGTLTRREAASLAGVAPHPKDSGTIKGYRRMRGGRPIIRAILFMAALAASRAKGELRAFYQHLIEVGKKPIVAIGALMRKIVVILNARVRDNHAEQS